MGFKILKYDDSIIKPMDNATYNEYILNRTNYATIMFKPKINPMNAWATPFVTGHKYKIHWGVTGLDFEKMRLTMSKKWEDTDKSIYLVHNFTDVRAAVTSKFNGQLVDNNTIPANVADYKAGQNLILNDTATREVHLIVNGKGQGANPTLESDIYLEGVRCIGSCNEDIVEVDEPEPEFRYWSDVKNWPNETLPKEGDDVHIISGWKMILDIPETPIFQLIRVNGILIFNETMDIHLRAKHIFIRAGELHIGNETHPYQPNALITLYGEKNAEAMVYDNAIEAGNKLIANVNLVKMYGKPRKQKMTRLLKEVFKGDTSILIEAGLDLVPGDRIALLATSFKHDASDYFELSGYDPLTGIATFSKALKYYHWGAPESTAAKYNGLDIRGEVLILSRNIQIRGEDVESWGCQIVTSDTIEFDGITGELKYRYGQMFMDNVEVYNCSQIDTYKAAIRFENAVALHSEVTNSTFHNGLSWGATIKGSANIVLRDNLWFNFRPVGIGIDFCQNVTFDNNVVGHVVERTTIESGDKFVDKAAGVAVCSYHDSTCSDMKITNNIVGGAVYAGFVVMGNDCGDYNTVTFRGNVAHSMEGIKSGMGALMYPDPARPSHETCFQASYFSAYKCYYQGAFTYSFTQAVKFTHMTMIDNRMGFGASMKHTNDYNDIYIELSDNKVYGESEISDCPDDGSFCKMIEKFGLMMMGPTFKGKALHIDGMATLPAHKIKSLSSWGGVQKMYRNEFIGFDSKTRQGLRQSIFAMNPFQADYLPMMEFFDSKFTDVKSFAYIMDPIPGWANLDDCGDFPCTAPLNVLMMFQGTKFEGAEPYWATKDFSIIANNSGFAPYIEGCRPDKINNAYACVDTENLGILLFESEDEDKQDRSM